MIRKASPEVTAQTQKELRDWEECLRELQSLRTVSVSLDNLKAEIPSLETNINGKEAELPALTEQAEQV